MVDSDIEDNTKEGFERCYEWRVFYYRVNLINNPKGAEGSGHSRREANVVNIAEGNRRYPKTSE